MYQGGDNHVPGAPVPYQNQPSYDQSQYGEPVQGIPVDNQPLPYYNNAQGIQQQHGVSTNPPAVRHETQEDVQAVSGVIDHEFASRQPVEDSTTKMKQQVNDQNDIFE